MPDDRAPTFHGHLLRIHSTVWHDEIVMCSVNFIDHALGFTWWPRHVFPHVHHILATLIAVFFHCLLGQEMPQNSLGESLQGTGWFSKNWHVWSQKWQEWRFFFNGILDFLIQIPFYPVPCAHLIELQLHHELNLECIYTPWNRDVSKNWSKTNSGKTRCFDGKKKQIKHFQQAVFQLNVSVGIPTENLGSPKTKVPSLLRTLLARGSIQHETTSTRPFENGRLGAGILHQS